MHIRNIVNVDYTENLVIRYPYSTVMRRLTTGIRSEICVVRRLRRCVNVMECSYSNLDGIAYYTPRLYGIAYCP
jgi:hypothetical protein